MLMMVRNGVLLLNRRGSCMGHRCELQMLLLLLLLLQLRLLVLIDALFLENAASDAGCWRIRHKHCG